MPLKKLQILKISNRFGYKKLEKTKDYFQKLLNDRKLLLKLLVEELLLLKKNICQKENKNS